MYITKRPTILKWQIERRDRKKDSLARSRENKCMKCEIEKVASSRDRSRIYRISRAKYGNTTHATSKTWNCKKRLVWRCVTCGGQLTGAVTLLPKTWLILHRASAAAATSASAFTPRRTFATPSRGVLHVQTDRRVAQTTVWQTDIAWTRKQ